MLVLSGRLLHALSEAVFKLACSLLYAPFSHSDDARQLCLACNLTENYPDQFLFNASVRVTGH